MRCWCGSGEQGEHAGGVVGHYFIQADVAQRLHAEALEEARAAGAEVIEHTPSDATVIWPTEGQAGWAYLTGFIVALYTEEIVACIEALGHVIERQDNGAGPAARSALEELRAVLEEAGNGSANG